MIRPVMVAAVDPYAGVDEPGAAPNWTVYPNPARGYFRVEWPQGTVSARVELMDPMGRLVRQWPAGAEEFSLQGVVPGPYLVRLSTPAGEPLGHGRLIVQR
jgi:hypothetical protein